VVRGEIVDDLGPASSCEVTSIGAHPSLPEQPEALTRAALEPCSGGGVSSRAYELTGRCATGELYSAPFRIKLATIAIRGSCRIWDSLLTPEKAFGGTVRRRAPLPRRCRAISRAGMDCPGSATLSAVSSFTDGNDFPSGAWWPALLRSMLLPQLFYREVMNPKLPPKRGQVL